MFDFNEFSPRHELGLFLPPTVDSEDDLSVQDIKHVSAYFTYANGRRLLVGFKRGPKRYS